MPQHYGNRPIVVDELKRSGGYTYELYEGNGADFTRNRGLMLYADYYMSRTLICDVCGLSLKRWDEVCEHTLNTGHNAYDVGEPTHHEPKTPTPGNGSGYEEAWRRGWSGGGKGVGRMSREGGPRE